MELADRELAGLGFTVANPRADPSGGTRGAGPSRGVADLPGVEGRGRRVGFRRPASSGSPRAPL